MEKEKSLIIRNMWKLGKIFKDYGVETKTPEDPFFNTIMDLLCENAGINPKEESMEDREKRHERMHASIAKMIEISQELKDDIAKRN